MAQSNGNEHSGHRKRLKNKFVENGFDIFEPHEALEMYLFYAIPRKDTNPLAHRLLDRYLTIGGVCDAPIDELIKDFGLSWSAAVYLKMLPEMSRLYNESKLSNDYIIDPDTLGDKFKAKFIGRTSEAVALILGDAKGKMIYLILFPKALSILPNCQYAKLSIWHFVIMPRLPLLLIITQAVLHSRLRETLKPLISYLQPYAVWGLI